MRLEGRVAIVTGAARGIGQAYALRLASEGADIVVADLLDGGETAQEVEALGRSCLPLQVDVSDPEQVDAMAAQVDKRFGRIDVLINNAAMMAELSQATPFEELDVDEWDRVMAVNVRGTWLCCRAVMPIMRRQGKGKIVNIASVVAFIGTPWILHYCASKGAVVAITRSLAKELAGTGIIVNAIAPGLTETPALMETLGERRDEVVDWMVSGQIVQRFEQPGDLVGACAFLSSDDSDFVAGQTLVVDGGFHTH